MEMHALQSQQKVEKEISTIDVQKQEGQFNFLQNAKEGLALLGAIASVGGVAVAEAATPPDVTSSAARSKLIRLYKECGDPLVVNQGMGHRRTKSKEGSLQVINVENNQREKFIWKHKSSMTLCGIAGVRSDNKVVFARPTKRTKTGGYFMDPATDGPQAIGQFSVFLRPKK
jgi:hypothetical protein